MSISNNSLSSFMCGSASIEEYNEVVKELANDESLMDVLEIIDEIDSSDDIDNLRHEFCESIDPQKEINEIYLNIK